MGALHMSMTSGHQDTSALLTQRLLFDQQARAIDTNLDC